MLHDPILHLLGLAKKAGKLEVGEEPVGAVCRSRHARLLLLASDAAPNTCRRAAHFGEAGNVLWLQLPHSKDEIGFLLGRKSCAMVAVTDFGIAAAIGEKLAALDPRYVPASEQLRVRAERALQRQREKRQHERNVQMGKRKPWVAPPVKEDPAASPSKEKSTVQRTNVRKSKPTGEPQKSSSYRSDRASSSGKGRTGAAKRPADAKDTGAKRFASYKSGPGGRKLTARPMPGGKRPSKP
jgi:ribosomal protein L7Ae-like RNA K-turn-binding protein